MVKNSPGNAADTRDTGLMPGFVRCPGEGNGRPLQCSCLEISMDRGAWWATVHRIGKSGTQLSRSHKDHRRSNMYIVGSLPGSLNDPCLLVGEKRESVVAQSCPTLCDPMDWSLGLWPASFLCPWNSLGKNTGVACHFLPQGSFLTQGSNPGFLHCRQILYRLSHFHGSLPPCLILVYSPPTLC